MAFICGSIYFQLEPNIGSINNRYGALFFIALNQFQMSMQSSILTCFILFFNFIIYFQKVPSERAVFLKEENSKMYGVGAYFLSKNVTEAPPLVFIPTVFSLLIYWAIDFNTSSHEKYAIFCKT